MVNKVRRRDPWLDHLVQGCIHSRLDELSAGFPCRFRPFSDTRHAFHSHSRAPSSPIPPYHCRVTTATATLSCLAGWVCLCVCVPISTRYDVRGLPARYTYTHIDRECCSCCCCCCCCSHDCVQLDGGGTAEITASVALEPLTWIRRRARLVKHWLIALSIEKPKKSSV